MTHRIFVPQAPQANRTLARQPLWLIVLLLALWLSVLLLAMQAYPQSAGPEFPNPSDAHTVLTQPQDATNAPYSFSSTNRGTRNQNSRNQERSYEKIVMRVNG